MHPDRMGLGDRQDIGLLPLLEPTAQFVIAVDRIPDHPLHGDASGEGTRQSDSKYFHVYQNGACYEFALNVTTDASAEGLVKHVDRDKVFTRLEQILSTVKINPITPEVTAAAPSPAPPQTPAQ